MRKNLGNKHMPNTFLVYLEYWQGKFWRVAHNLPNSPFFPTKIFLCMVVFIRMCKIKITKFNALKVLPYSWF